VKEVCCRSSFSQRKIKVSGIRLNQEEDAGFGVDKGFCVMIFVFPANEIHQTECK
jgi:hypothetical protein